VEAADPKRLEPLAGDRREVLLPVLRLVIEGGRDAARPDPEKRELEGVLRL
jgi:hypothetical protein